MQAFGATVVEFGRISTRRSTQLFRQRPTRAAFRAVIPSILVAGVATYALELFRAVADLDTVYVGIGMGSGICGLIAVRDLLGLKTEIVGVGSLNARATALSFAAGKRVTTQSALTFADGIATREPHEDVIATSFGELRASWRSARTPLPRQCGSISMTRIRLQKGPAQHRWRPCCKSGNEWPTERPPSS